MPSDEIFDLTIAKTGDSISSAMSPDKSLAKPPRPRPRDAESGRTPPSRADLDSVKGLTGPNDGPRCPWTLAILIRRTWVWRWKGSKAPFL